MEEQVRKCLLLKENSNTSTFWNKQEDANMKKGEIRQNWAGLEKVKGESRKVKEIPTPGTHSHELWPRTLF